MSTEIEQLKAQVSDLLAELAKAQQENADAYQRGWDEPQEFIATLRADLVRNLAERDAARADAASLRTALEGLPEEIAQKIVRMTAPSPPTGHTHSALVRNRALDDAAEAARSFAASRPCGHPNHGSQDHDCAAFASRPTPAPETGHRTQEGHPSLGDCDECAVTRCRHCGDLGPANEDHTCPCPFTDADCVEHRPTESGAGE